MSNKADRVVEAKPMSPKEPVNPMHEDNRPKKSSWPHAGHSVREQLHYVDEPATLTEHQKEMSFLQHLMLYDNTEQRHVMEEKLTGAENNERCARRAVWLMTVLTALAVVGLGYAALLLEDFPPNKSQFITRIFCAFGLASLVSLFAFVGFWLVSRGKLDDEREGCRRLVTRILETRLGKPHAAASPEILRTKSFHSRVTAETPRVANAENG